MKRKITRYSVATNATFFTQNLTHRNRIAMSLSYDNAQYIETTDQLESLCLELSTKTWIAVDTEFLREKTYKPQLCLIQVASDEHLACIDPLALDNIDVFLDVLFDRNILKVFHAASQDLEIFYWLRGEVPGPLFDTQIAAPLLGHNEQIGYGNLVKGALGIDLAKSHSRADWTRRPLPAVQLNYAMDDVIYLCQLYTQMNEALESRNRLVWLEQDFTGLESSNLYNKPAADMWLKVRGVQKYKGKTLSAIQKLAEWREIVAKESDLPRNWLLKDEIIIDIARQLPDSVPELKHIRGLSESIVRKHGNKLVALLADAAANPPIPLPPFKKKSKLSPAQDAIIDLLTTLTKLRSEELEVNSAVLAPRKELEKLFTDPESSRLTQGWRKMLIGEQLLDLLDGKISMRIENSKICMDSIK